MPLEGLRASNTFCVRHDSDTVPAESALGLPLAIIAAGFDDSDQGLKLLTEALEHHDAVIRRHALTALERKQSLKEEQLLAAMADLEPENAARAIRLAARREVPSEALEEALVLATQSSHDFVVVAAVRSLADLEVARALDLFIDLATQHPDPMVREEAVAGLGVLGNEQGLEAVLGACKDKPAIRRRCVVALGAFEGDRVEAALDVLSADRDWQVRQAVAMLRRADSDS